MRNLIRMGFIGAGHVLQEIHLPLFSHMEEVLPLVLCDIRESALTNALKKFGVRETTTNWQDVLAMQEVDAVLITLPHDLHAQVAECALRASKHVLCEKPAAIDVPGARAVEKAMDDSGAIYMMALPYRFDAEAVLLQRMIAAGRLGRVYHVRAGITRRDACPGGWFTDRERSGGGALVQFGSHLIDLAAWLMDFAPVERISAVAYQKSGPVKVPSGKTPPAPRVRGGPVHDVEDSSTVLMRVEGNRSTLIEVAWAQDTGTDRQYLEVYGDRAGASLWPLRIHGEVDGTAAEIAPRCPQTNNYQQLARHFVECILRHGRGEKVRPVGTASDGVRLAVVVQNIYHSIETEREVDLVWKSSVDSQEVMA